MPTITADDGARISYQRSGEGPAVLLVQGVGIVGEGWRPQVLGLRDRFTVVCLDNRGIGESSLPKGAEVSVPRMASDALAVMDAERIDRFHVGGHSLGGAIAAQIALSATPRIKSLTLMCTFAHGKQGARIDAEILVSGLRTRIGTRRMRRRAFLELVMPRAHLDSLADVDGYAAELAPLFGHDLADSPAVAMKQLRALGRFDARDALATLRVPTLVVAASGDRIARPAFGRELAAIIPGARYVEIDDAGHGVTIHRPADVNRLLGDHLAANEA